MPASNRLRQSLISGGTLLAATALLLIPLFYNGCPLFYPDSMGYIFWGQQGQPVPERVSTYALMIRGISLGRDLWFVIVFQTLIGAYLLRAIWQKIQGRPLDGLFFGAVACLGLLSPLGWTASTLMPDLFCVMSSLFLYLLLFPEDGKKPSYLHLGGFAICASQHLGNLMINGLLLGLFFAYFLWQRELRKKVAGLVLGLAGLVISYVGIGAVHYSMSGEFYLTKSSSAFLTGRLIETGLASQYLDQHQGEMPSFQLFRKQLPMSAEHFLWNKDSPIYSLGGLHDSFGKMAVFNKEVLSSPVYLFLFAKAGVKSGFKQLLQLDLGDGLLPAANLQLYIYPENHAEYWLSKQQSGIDFKTLNSWCMSFLAILFLFFMLKVLPHGFNNELIQFGLFIVLLFFLNAIVNGALSTPLNRYQVRVFWLVYFWLLAAAYPVLRSNFPVNQKSNI